VYTTVTELLSEWNEEAALTQAVMDALTDGSLGQEVWPGGRTLGGIAWHIVTSTPEFLSAFGVKIDAAAAPEGVPASAREIAEGWRSVSAASAERMRDQLDDASLGRVQNAFGREMPTGAIVALLVKHHIHHRGQMTILMRQAGVKTPGVYGPAKEEWVHFGVTTPPA
jgi:uncharacterized damage-inducible protein DinB